MLTINPYLNFNGDTEKAFNFYKSVFGGEFDSIQRFKDVPGLPGAEAMTDSEKEGIMHVALPLGNGNTLMGSDNVPSLGHPKADGNNISLSLNVGSKEEAERLFSGLSAGGQVEMPLADMFWGAYFGMFTDKFGIRWMVNYEYPR